MKKQMLVIVNKVRSRLRNKLIFTFSFIVLFIVVFLSLLAYKQTTHIIEKNFIETNKKILKLVNQNLDNYVDQIDSISLTPRKDAQFLNALYSNEYTGQLYIQNQMKNMFYSREDIEKIVVYTLIDKQAYIISRSSVNMTQEDNDQIPKEAWYEEAIQGPRFLNIEPVGQVTMPEDNQDFFIFHRAIINIADKKPLAIVSITMNDKGVTKILNDIMGNSNEFIGVFNQKNQAFYLKGLLLSEADQMDLLSSMDRNYINSSYKIWSKDHESYLTSYNTSERFAWKLVKVTPMNTLNQDAANARRSNLFIGTLFVIFFILIIFIVTNAITKRLKEFSKRIDQLGEGNFSLANEIKGSDEIANLSRKFNQMVTKINELIAERYQIKINERNARLRALEAQINPHFLYNSLQAISTEAIINDMSNIHYMIDALASSLRYCIREGETVRVSDEIQHINYYLILQKARFGERLNVQFKISLDVYQFFIPKMLLQILVENAIEHALEQMTEAIHIQIEAHLLDGFMRWTVRDDGVGINEQRLEEIVNGFNEDYLDYHEGIGLKNLYSRIKLMFGDEARLNMVSQVNQGTTVEIHLPIRKEALYV